MNEENLYRIVEVSVKRDAGRQDIGIMTVRQALALPDIPSLEYTHLDPRDDGNKAFLTRDELKACMAA